MQQTLAHFALAPGSYRAEVRYTNGTRRTRDITLAATALRAVINDNTPRTE